jgi:RNA-binding protein
MLTPHMKRRIKHAMSAKRPSVWIGKHGISTEALTEINHQLERTEIVKVRILKPALEGNIAKMIAEETAQYTQSTIVEVRGHTFILFREKKKTPV